jgi:hypothetical protein
MNWWGCKARPAAWKTVLNPVATPIIFAEFTELVADSVKWLEKEAQRKADSGLKVEGGNSKSGPSPRLQRHSPCQQGQRAPSELHYPSVLLVVKSLRTGLADDRVSPAAS